MNGSDLERITRMLINALVEMGMDKLEAYEIILDLGVRS